MGLIIDFDTTQPKLRFSSRKAVFRGIVLSLFFAFVSHITYHISIFSSPHLFRSTMVENYRLSIKRTSFSRNRITSVLACYFRIIRNASNEELFHSLYGALGNINRAKFDFANPLEIRANIGISRIW